MLIEIIAFMLVGTLAGISAGLLGIGGGLIIVPFSLMIFDYLSHNDGISIPFEFQAHIAIATSLASIIFTSISAIYAQQKKKAIDWPIFFVLVPGVISGAFLGAWLIQFISREPLLLFFSCFLVLVSIKMWLGWSPRRQGKLPAYFGMTTVATIIGSVSALIGIGGGTMTVPFLNWGKIPIQRAIAISSALGLPIALSGSFVFLCSALPLDLTANVQNNLLQSSLWGYIYLPAFFCIISTSIISTRLGVYLSHRLSNQKLSHIFSILLMGLAVKLLVL